MIIVCRMERFVFIVFFFFKQKTAYEIETDWSSDVCSSDLGEFHRWIAVAPTQSAAHREGGACRCDSRTRAPDHGEDGDDCETRSGDDRAPTRATGLRVRHDESVRHRERDGAARTFRGPIRVRHIAKRTRECGDDR